MIESLSRIASSNRRLLFWLIQSVPVAIALLFWGLAGTALSDGDSPCYLQWCPKRTAVYPLFLDAVPAPILLPVQLGLLASSIGLLNWVILKRSGSLLPAFLLTVGIVANPYLWQLQGSIMSEGLTTPLLILVLAATLNFVLGGRPRSLAAAAFLAGVMTATRPSCLPIVLIPLVALVLSKSPPVRAKLSLALAGGLLWALPIAADRLVSRFVHGEELTSLAGRHLYAKASIIDAPPVDRSGLAPLERRAVDLMEGGYAPIRDRLRDIGQGPVRDILRLNYEVCIQYACTERALEGPTVRRSDLDDALFAAGWARVRQNPDALAPLAWDEYRGLWLLHPRKAPDNAAAYNHYLLGSPPLPFGEQLGIEGQPVPPGEQKAVYRLNRSVFIALGFLVPLAGLAALFAFVRKTRGPWVIMTIAAVVGVEATLVFAAFFGVGIPRYTMGLWPVIVVVLVWPLLSAIRRLRSVRTGENEQRRT